eukprot:m.356463 g.356463  ORF g.356463 m.356463 type:complete len:153 (+) comp17547_c0_seq1:115-573(+)
MVGSKVLFFGTLLCLIACAMAKVTTITAANFEDTIAKSDEVWVLEVYSDMCGSCAEFKPTFDKVAAKIDHVHFGALNVDSKEGAKLAKDLNALQKGLPGVLVFHNANSEPKSIVAGEGVSDTEFTKLVQYNIPNRLSSNGKVIKLARGNNEL